MKYYDPSRHQLIYLESLATPEYWDEHWQGLNSRHINLTGVTNTFVTRETRKYILPHDGFILEGGCGRAQHVSALVSNGYQCIGIDSAPETIRWVNTTFPALDVRLGDVTHTDFPDHFFVGYWSLGLIEHFWQGYECLINEAARIIRPGGYFFITFPYMSPLRKWKALTKQYQEWTNDTCPVDFYQYALDHQIVIKAIIGHGFTLKSARPFDGIKGLKSEITWLHQPLQRLYDDRNQAFLVRATRFMISELLAILAGHTMLLVFQRNLL